MLHTLPVLLFLGSGFRFCITGRVRSTTKLQSLAFQIGLVLHTLPVLLFLGSGFRFCITGRVRSTTKLQSLAFQIGFNALLEDEICVDRYILVFTASNCSPYYTFYEGFSVEDI